MLYLLTVLHFLHVDNAGCLSSLSCFTKLGLKSTSEICKTNYARSSEKYNFNNILYTH